MTYIWKPVHAKLRLGELGLQLVPVKFVKNPILILLTLLRRNTKNKNINHLYKDELVKCSSKHSMHEYLKYGRSIA